MTASTYRPEPDTIAYRALELIEKLGDTMPRGSWVPNVDVSRALGVRPNAIRPSLETSVKAGLVERSLCPSGFTQWRLRVIKPRRKPKAAAPVIEARSFGIPDWPPGFVSQFDSVAVASYETRRK